MLPKIAAAAKSFETKKTAVQMEVKVNRTESAKRLMLIRLSKSGFKFSSRDFPEFINTTFLFK